MAFDYNGTIQFMDDFLEGVPAENETDLNFIKTMRERIALAQEEINNLTESLSDVPPETDIRDKDGVLWRQKYDDLSRRYRERFFSGRDRAIEDQRRDIEKDDESPVTTFEALFKDREGDYN